MQTSTKYYIADCIFGLLMFFLAYVVIAFTHMFIDYALNKGPEDFDEPWLWFGGMVFLPLVIVFYGTFILKIMAFAYNVASKYNKELTGKDFKEIRCRPLKNDLPPLFGTFILTPYISQQIYGMMEGASDMIFVAMALVPAITCVCAMYAYQHYIALMDRKFEKRRAERKARKQALKEVLE